MTSYVGLAAWAFAAGALIPVMGALNAGLSRSLGSAPIAALVLFGVAFCGVATVCLVTRQAMPTGSAFAAAPARLYFGGLIVAFYVLSVTLLIPVFGVGNTILFAMVAQILISAMMDAVGLFGAPVRGLSLMRLSGLALMIAGLVITQLGANRSP